MYPAVPDPTHAHVSSCLRLPQNLMRPQGLPQGWTWTGTRPARRQVLSSVHPHGWAEDFPLERPPGGCFFRLWMRTPFLLFDLVYLKQTRRVTLTGLELAVKTNPT